MRQWNVLQQRHRCTLLASPPRQPSLAIMNTTGGEVRFGELVDFSAVDSSSAWEVGVAGDIETVIRDVKHEITDTDFHQDLPPWASGSGTPENYPSMLMPPLKSKRTFSDILRGVKVREDTLQCAVARLGGGAQGLRVLMEHVNFWALESQDEDVTAAIRRGIVDLGMPPAPKRHCNPGMSTNSEGNARGACFDAQWKQASPRDVAGTCESVNYGAAYTRALRKSHMLRQRGQTRVRRHHSEGKCGTQSRPWRPSSSRQWSHDAEPKMSNENRKGYEFLFQKELRASDVSSLGRIVLPKKDAERHLPFLIVREGIMISLEDYHSGKFWTARYRFWPNNKSRMYLLESIGDFVNFHHLQGGDLLLCYRNEQGGYVIRGQKMAANVKAPGKVPSVERLEARENTSTSERKTVTTVMPAAHEFVDGKSSCGTPTSNSTQSSFDSLDCTSGKVGDGKYFQDGYSRHQDAFYQQTCYPSYCGGDVLRTDFPASYTPVVHDPVVVMLAPTNVKQRYMEDNHFLV